jgi:hypothetical protein
MSPVLGRLVGSSIAMATGLQRHGRRCHGNWLLMSDGCGMGEIPLLGGAMVLARLLSV